MKPNCQPFSCKPTVCASRSAPFVRGFLLNIGSDWLQINKCMSSWDSEGDSARDSGTGAGGTSDPPVAWGVLGRPGRSWVVALWECPTRGNTNLGRWDVLNPVSAPEEEEVSLSPTISETCSSRLLKLMFGSHWIHSLRSFSGSLLITAGARQSIKAQALSLGGVAPAVPKGCLGSPIIHSLGRG